MYTLGEHMAGQYDHLPKEFWDSYDAQPWLSREHLDWIHGRPHQAAQPATISQRPAPTTRTRIRGRKAEYSGRFEGRAKPEEIAAWQAAALRINVDLTTFIRDAANAAAKAD